MDERSSGALRVKICGLTRREDALAADMAGADYLGVILSKGFGRSLPVASARDVVHGTRAKKVAVIVDESADAAVDAARALGADVIQLHGSEAPELLAEIRSRGEWALWKALRVRSVGDVEEGVRRYEAVADGILVEGWKEGSVGGVGARLGVDPAEVRSLVRGRATFVLAGGLGPETVADAVRAFHPDVVDVSSGVELALGVKDHARVRDFIEAARGAAAVTRAI